MGLIKALENISSSAYYICTLLSDKLLRKKPFNISCYNFSIIYSLGVTIKFNVEFELILANFR